jgi:hypothetical protein
LYAINPPNGCLSDLRKLSLSGGSTRPGCLQLITNTAAETKNKRYRKIFFR